MTLRACPVIVRSVPAQSPEPHSAATPLAKVVGANCKQLRTRIGGTQDDLARAARRIGLDWTETRVGHFEAGRSTPTFATVLAITLALQMTLEDVSEQRCEIPDWGVTLSHLLGREGDVALTDKLDVPAALLADVCEGRVFTLPLTTGSIGLGPREIHALVEEMTEARRQREVEAGITVDELTELILRQGLTEHRLAEQLGISHARLAHMSFLLWQSTFSEERDRQAGPDANPQKKGRITRELRGELERALSDGDD